MNRDEIQNATPQELRVRIAMLMGWKQSPLGNWPWQMVPPGGDGTKVRNCPNYPITWEAAGQVIEKMREKGWWIDRLTTWVNTGHCTVIFRLDAETIVEATCATAPEAICKAALLAVNNV